ncbi:fatty acid synthase [Microplitis demolitor]|uniref:fatty acid synthase n=1 Tax=Microplitis demolitor TaxID=69319 RepID=UPI0004CD6441|nr:fatty acid synthase [Microplitis demolitor]
MKDKNQTESAGSFNPCTQSMMDPGEEIVISGIAGRFPESDNMRHFQENLFNKVDLVTDDDRRWKLDHPEIPQRTGKINNVGKFDALFFGVHFKQAHTMDPMCRMLMEHAFEAIVDAGVNPRHLRGTRTGVFIGACFSESEKTWFYEKLQVNGFGITGCSRAMLANRLSYWLGVTGPSYTVDSACSSSLFAMEHAYRAIRNGQCDAALVGGANLCLHPYVSLQFSRLGVLSADGRCKSFDADANGYTRSETVSIAFLQKAKDAKRIYATVIHGKTNCDGFKEQGITFPSSVMQSVLLKEFYDECKIPPSIVNYIEAHGTGTKVGDPEEVNAIDTVFCPGRKEPLRIGSIKSNLGHAEPASGMCSIAKVVIANESGIIPPNLHYKRPREGVKALEEGRVKVITEPTPWEGGYVGVSSFGFGGANAHILLKSNPIDKINGGAPNDDLPRLVVVSGRTEAAVEALLHDVESRPLDVEYVRLLQDIHSEDIPGHLYRGYTILSKHTTQENRIRDIEHYPGAKRPIWFVFSGMGSQWPGMGTALLRFPIFAQAVKKCDAVLKPRGVDIYDILTNPNKSTFDNILNSFVGIAAVQIGLVDLLTSLGIVPDRIIGHSVGELGCAYADGCFTAEQMVLAAYSRGLASIETKTIFGSMAAVGLGYEDIKDLCPPDIEVACHNGPESSTISGPAESMKAFVAKLQSNKIFAREVPCSNIAYHSRYIAEAGPKLMKYLKEVIPDPKPRSPKWLSTSVPRSQWSTPQARLSSAEYHTNNLLNAVLFEETAVLIPKDAVTIEIAPHGLLQAILRRSLSPSVTNIPLTQRGHKDNVEVFLQAIGKVYDVGYQPQIANIYPEVQYPVSRGTPMISPLIKWEHADDWYVTSYRMQEKITSGERTVEVTLSDEDYEYMSGHVIDGRNLFPATGYLALVWETIGMMKGELYTEVSVVFDDVKFLRATTIPKEGIVEVTLMVQKGTGRFEVVEGGVAVVTGYVHYTTKPSLAKMNPPVPEDQEEEEMSSRDVYKELRLRGYHYSGLFRGIKSASTTGQRGKIAWANNWVAFMDNMLQMQILEMDSRGLFVPTGIQRLVIDTKTHLNQIRAMPDDVKEFPIYRYKTLDLIVAGGVEIRGLKASAIGRRKPAGEPVLESYRFVAHRDQAEISLQEAVRLATHLALENYLGVKVKTLENLEADEKYPVEDLFTPIVQEVLGDIPLIQADLNILAHGNPFEEDKLPANINVTEAKKLPPDTNAMILTGRGLLTKEKSGSLSQLLFALKDGGFVLTLESRTISDLSAAAKKHNLDIILEKLVNNSLCILLRKRDKLPKKSVVVRVDNDSFAWVDELKSVLEKEKEREFSGSSRVILVSEKSFESGLLGLVNCLRKEPGGEVIRGVLVQDEKAPDFSLTSALYADQLKLDLALNVLRPNKTWGSYRHLHLPAPVPRPVNHAWANQIVRGDMSSFRWLEGPIQPGFSHPDLVDVVYSAVNFRDIMVASGKLAAEVVAKNRFLEECCIGFEYSGIDRFGKRVMGLVPARALTNKIVIDRHLSWYVPDGWTLEEAATVPCVYATVYNALYISGKMKKGDKVLIHAGSGGTGQAAINLALNEGCEIFTTVGTPEKRKFIRDNFPQIPDDHIGNSRDTSFETMILEKTNGRGVDIVLNSLADEKLQASLRCLGSGGRFLEIGKFDMVNDSHIGMAAFLKEISFHGILLDLLFNAETEKKIALKNILQKGLDSGVIKPLVRTVFPKENVEAAYRYMAAGKHIGKVLIKVIDEKNIQNTILPAIPRYNCLQNCSYIILGGLGGFGLELADWLILRGAHNLVLTSRSGLKNGYQRMRVRLWKSYGVKIEIITGKNAANHQDCEDIIKAAENLAPVDGIFNLAVILKDGLIENQTPDTFKESFTAKAWSTKVLDEVSRKFCPNLRHFVVFSSVSCGRGNAGQTNYGMSNSIMERICEKRVAQGFPALAVQWGAVGDVGLVADMQEDNKELVIGGTLQQKITSCLQELNYFLTQNNPIVSSMVVAEKRAGGAGSLNIVDTVLNIMGVKDLKTVSHHTSLAELGMDSMMAVEIKQSLEREFEIYLTAQDIRGLNFAKLIEMNSKDLEKKSMNRSSNTDTETLTGMKLFVRLLGEENEFSEICMKLQTREEAGRHEVFLIPGIEGCGSVFFNLASKIKSPATCLQLDNTNTEYLSIFDMANQLLPHLLKRNEGRRDFVIAGYSFGSLVAIELARKLEAQGLTGRLVLIDGSPDLMKAIKEQQLSSSSDEELATNVLVGIIDLIAPSLSGELFMELQKCDSFKSKLDAFMARVPTESLSISRENQRNICAAVYNRLIALQNYDTSNLPPLRSSIILLKPSMPTLKSVSGDYGLSSITREKVEVHVIDGNHVTILDEAKIATAINGEPLEDAEAFKARIMEDGKILAPISDPHYSRA